MFPEIDYDTVDTSRGMDITIVTTAIRPTPKVEHSSKPSAFPFRREGQAQ